MTRLIHFGMPLLHDSDLRFEKIRLWANVANEEIIKRPELSFPSGICQQCLDAKPWSEEEVLAMERSCAGERSDQLEREGGLLTLADLKKIVQEHPYNGCETK